MSSPDPTAATSAHSALRRWLLRAVVALALLALLWTVVVGWWLPRLLQPRIEAAASAALGAPFTIERIEIAPWTLEARAFGLRLGPAGATPWLRVAAVHAEVALESVWRLAPVLDRLSVRAPQVELERLADGRYNVTPMLEALARRPAPAEDSEPARFAVHNIRFEDGLVHVVDRVGGSEHRVEHLRIGIPFLSNLPSKVKVDVEPLLDAQVDGSALHLQGRTRPFSADLSSALELRWQQVDVAHWIDSIAPLLPQPLPLEVQRGRLDLALQIAFERRAAPAVPSLHVSGDATLSQVQASVSAQGLQIAWDRLALQGIELRPFERRANVATLTLQAPAFDVDLPRLLATSGNGADAVAVRAPSAAVAPSTAARGESAAAPALAASAAPASNAASAASAGSVPTAPRAASAPPSPRAAPKKNEASWQWQVGKVVVADGRALLHDPAWPKGQALAPIDASVADLGNAEGKPASWSASVADAQGAQVKVEGTLGIAARQVALSADVAGLKLLPWIAPWQGLLPVRLQDGKLAMQARAEVGPAGWRLHDTAVRLSGLQVAPLAAAPAGRGVVADRLVVAEVAASGVQLQSLAGAPLVAKIDALRFDRLDLKASRDAHGAIAWLPHRATASDAPSSPDTPAARAPTWQLGELRCSGCAVAWLDRSMKPALAFALSRTDLSLRKLGDDLRQPIDFEISAVTGRSGRAKARGNMRLQPLALRSRIDLAAVDLGMIQPYLDPYVNITLTAAKASAAGDLRIDGDARTGIASARWRGRVALNDVHALDRLNAAEFVRFKGLSLDGADISWRPSAYEADLGNVALDDFYGRVIINGDGRVNLRDIVKHDKAEGAQSLTTPSEPGAAPPAGAASAPNAAPAPTPVRWRAIRLTGGEVDYTDNFIRPNYSARLTGIAGEISALAWDNPKPADVRIAGKVDGSAPLEISGTINPLGARLHTDINAEARGIDITRLSAYAARYAGYGIEKGTLTMKVHYRVDNGKLEAENHIYLDQLTFGKKVDSPDALKLPVLLAVSLLKDRNGVIDINLPISGSLDDPQFSIGGIIVRVIVNLITRAVTAPFTLLANAFGGGTGGTQQLSHVAFEPGSAEVGAAITPTLDTLARALADRPALKLEITGRADPAIDAPALQKAYLERLLRQAKSKATDEPAENVHIDPAERERWLEAAYKSADIKGKPRNLIGLQKTLPAPEMEAMLLKNAPNGADRLKTLADRRADHVKAYLGTKVAPERLLLTASRLDAEGMDDKGPATRVGFALK